MVNHVGFPRVDMVALLVFGQKAIAVLHIDVTMLRAHAKAGNEVRGDEG
jgi:hypothetical protein